LHLRLRNKWKVIGAKRGDVHLNVKVVNGNFTRNCYGWGGGRIYFAVKNKNSARHKICRKISDTYRGICLRKTKIRIKKRQMNCQRNKENKINQHRRLKTPDFLIIQLQVKKMSCETKQIQGGLPTSSSDRWFRQQLIIPFEGWAVQKHPL
jgi:hypothetical protein